MPFAAMPALSCPGCDRGRRPCWPKSVRGCTAEACSRWGGQRPARKGDRAAESEPGGLGPVLLAGTWRFEVIDMDGRRVDKILAKRREG
ncbi:MAG: hypothetical protein FJX54_23395 [Alphaproteobacteria bacterium]|nr:hypothetical protein [Alphaproteobacteria bacterium]